MKDKKQNAPPFQIVWTDIDAIASHPYNPRQISALQFDKLVKSLADCPDLFLARPILVSVRDSGERVIVGGDKRWRAAQRLDYKQVPTILFHGLTEEQEREIIIKDNGEFGEWDWDLLANNFSGLPLDDWGIRVPEDWIRPPDAEVAKMEPTDFSGSLDDGIGNYVIINFDNHEAYVQFLARLGMKDGVRSVGWDKVEPLLS